MLTKSFKELDIGMRDMMDWHFCYFCQMGPISLTGWYLLPGMS